MSGEEERVSSLIEQLATAEHPERAHIAAQLRMLGGERAIAAIESLLTHPEVSARACGALNLAVLEHRPSATHILPLLSDPSPYVRSMAALALGELQCVDAVEPLIALLAGGGPEEERWLYICGALGEIGDRRAVEPLLQMARHAQDLKQRFDAANALIELGEPEACDIMQELLEHPELPEQLRTCCIPAALKRWETRRGS